MPPSPAIRRWDVFWANLDPALGSEQAGRRPVLVISNDGFNARMPVVTVLPLTTREGKHRRAYAFEVELPRGVVSPGITSIVMPHQVRTVAKSRLLNMAGRITDTGQRHTIELRLLDHLDISVDAV